MIPHFDPLELATRDIEAIFAPVGSRNEPCVFVQPDIQSWSGFDSCVGAPGIRRDDYTYRTPEAPNTWRLMPPLPPLVPIVDLSAAIRRYVALRIAQELLRLNEPETATSPEELLRSIGVTAPSRDAVIAAAALLVERTLPMDPEGVPGFRGPDELYRDDSPAER